MLLSMLTDIILLLHLQAVNTVIQGSAADMMKTAMIHLSNNLAKLWKDETTRPRML